MLVSLFPVVPVALLACTLINFSKNILTSQSPTGPGVLADLEELNKQLVISISEIRSLKLR